MYQMRGGPAPSSSYKAECNYFEGLPLFTRPLERVSSWERDGRKLGWTYVGGRNSLDSPVTNLPVFLTAKTIQQLPRRCLLGHSALSVLVEGLGI